MIQIRLILKAFAEKIEDDFRIADTAAFIQGRYMIEALMCTVGNMFGGKNAKYTYPEQPYTMNGREPELTEDEIQAQREAFIATLKTMEANFKHNKEKEKQNGKC